MISDVYVSWPWATGELYKHFGLNTNQKPGCNRVMPEVERNLNLVCWQWLNNWTVRWVKTDSAQTHKWPARRVCVNRLTSSSVSHLLMSSVDWLSFSSSPWKKERARERWRRRTECETWRYRRRRCELSVTLKPKYLKSKIILQKPDTPKTFIQLMEFNIFVQQFF